MFKSTGHDKTDPIRLRGKPGARDMPAWKKMGENGNALAQGYRHTLFCRLAPASGNPIKTAP